MKVFISWSGVRGRHVAEALRDWLPYVIHDIEPWTSSHDLDAGERWSPAIARELEQTRFGIVCVTAESRNSPWILFEAGALAKSLAEGRLCPYLVGLTPAELDGPLAQFQSVPAERDATLRLVKAIHAAMPESQLSDQRLQVTFERFWPDLETKLKSLPNTDLQRPLRPDRLILEEILEHVRGLSREPKMLSEIKDWDATVGEYGVQVSFKALGTKPEYVEFMVIGDTLFQSFLDRLYVNCLDRYFNVYTYGTSWTLCDTAGKAIEKHGDRDDRTLLEVGIVPGMTELAVVRLDAANARANSHPEADRK